MSANRFEHLFAHSDALVDAAAQRIADQLESAIARRGVAYMAVSGGRSPEALFRRLSALILPWQNVFITLVDERCVPIEHHDSNAQLVKQHLLRGYAAKATFLPLFDGTLNAEQACQRVSEMLQTWALPFDVVVLGMGEDGHTASWFPDASNISELLEPNNDAIFAVVQPHHAAHTRITLTASIVMQARTIHVLISGAKKRLVYQQAKTECKPQTTLPVRAVLHQTRVPVHVYLSA